MKAKLNDKRIIWAVLLVVCAVTTLSFAITTLARYTAQRSENMTLVPTSFYFDSNYLKENNPTYSIYSLEDRIVIELYNSKRTNKSQMDISYNVVVTNGTSNISSGIITTIEEKNTIEIIPIDVAYPVGVSVTSTEYECELSAVFNIADIGDNSYYTFIDKGEYCELTIMTSNNLTDDLDINWGTSYIPDTANPLMHSWTGTSGILTAGAFEKNSKYTLLFIEDTSQNRQILNPTIIDNNTINLP